MNLWQGLEAIVKNDSKFYWFIQFNKYIFFKKQNNYQILILYNHSNINFSIVSISNQNYLLLRFKANFMQHSLHLL
ncbi:hypothetical protein TTHERM_00697439 (macronuclear) [Tetrahymena thermophila SB210]|uniref:Uncharacterized protein n=1 Tax=Tetrahymena thermophila (strain SB210) TaxID=312017 RepID=A4VCT3_TETTS|nr:hypothetical protein TTHERM_00697439 [Tetrahymena thermophila SB210]EDK31345.1 hypothetical protein TTHERM_00697439 [Tetrahymena thermophila SB210]|eukprot:XP_001471467.1 hypothetical protein TTHERM_00697439 [Tetrahymena thermophila SB210]